VIDPTRVRRPCSCRGRSATYAGFLTKYAAYYNELRTHRSLNKDAPIHRAIQHVGRIVSAPVLGGLQSPLLPNLVFSTHNRWKPSIQHDQEQTIPIRELDATVHPPLKHNQLMSECRVSASSRLSIATKRTFLVRLRVIAALKAAGPLTARAIPAAWRWRPQPRVPSTDFCTLSRFSGYAIVVYLDYRHDQSPLRCSHTQ